MTAAQTALRALIRDHTITEYRRGHSWLASRLHQAERDILLKALRCVEEEEADSIPNPSQLMFEEYRT